MNSDSDQLMSSGPNPAAFLSLLEKISAAKWWHAEAACLGMAPDAPGDPDPFFPPFGGRGTEAEAVCSTCPVIEVCRREHGNEMFGVWGGTSVEQRRQQRREAS